MSCTNPNLIKYAIDDETGVIYHSFIGSARFTDPNTYGTPYVDKVWYGIVPCGKCASCRCDYSREWANRMILELKDHDKAIFLTLTYNNDNLPISDKGFPTLDKRHIQLFFKRLRKHFDGIKIRYYVAGEYGSHTFRPHYHAIVYGIGLTDFDDLVFRGTNEIGSPFYSSPTLEKIWSHGFILFSDVTWRTCNYVARYVLKKQSQIDEVEGTVTLPFNLSSRNPGIGMNASIDLLKSGDSIFPVDGKDGIHNIPIPSSIIKRLKEKDDLGFDNLREVVYNRSIFARDDLLSKLAAYGKSFDDYCSNKNERLLQKLNILPRRK